MTPTPHGHEPRDATAAGAAEPGRLPVDPRSLTGWLVIATAVSVEQCCLLQPDQPVWLAFAGAGLWLAAAEMLRRLVQRLLRLVPEPAGDPPSAFGAERRVPRRRWCWQAWARGSLRAVVAAGVVAGALGSTTLIAAGGGSPEQLLMAFFRGVLLALLVVSRQEEMRLAVTITVFVVTFSTVVAEHPAAWVAETGYAIAAAALLASLSRRAAPRLSQAALRSPTASLPRPSQLAACLAVVVVVASLGRSTDRTGTTIAGFMPFSGGDSWAFPWALDGVGDGEQLVAATENPEATGPVDSDLFITSEEPSLYDVFNDLYGEPEPVRRQMSPAVALPSQSVTEPETKPAESNHAGRQFSSVRRPPQTRRPLSDLEAKSLVAVTGPLPVHLRLEVFHRFDGHVWHAESAADSTPLLRHAGDAWMEWETDTPIAATADAHEVTIGSLQSETLPLPARTERLQIDRIDQPSFYQLIDHELPALRGANVPASTTICFESLPGGLDGTPEMLPPSLLPMVSSAEAHTQLESGEPAEGSAPPAGWAARVLADWGLARPRDGRPTGWEPALQVVHRLRREYFLDPDTLPPASCDDAVAHFLTNSRRGPDYLFAGAATLLLRELGYTTRLAGGLWLSADDRDPLTRRAVADSRNAHLWCEVQTDNGRWIPVEASPLHQLRPLPFGWWQLWQAIARSAREVAGWLLQPLVSGSLAVLALAAAWWRPLANLLLTGLWRLALLRSSRCPLRPTWRLLEWRAWLAGCPRPPHETARRWYVAACDDAGGFITAVEEQAYGRGQACRAPAEHRRLAIAAEAAVSLAVLRQKHTCSVARRGSASLTWLPPLRLMQGARG